MTDTKLVHAETGVKIVVTDTVTDFRGAEWTLHSWTPPHHDGSTGRVTLSRPCPGHRDGDVCGGPGAWYCQGAELRTFFPAVINAKIVTV